MNSFVGAPVRAGIARMAAMLPLLAGGCSALTDDVTGVDLSWSLEALDGRRVDTCVSVRVSNIRLHWQVDGSESSEAWPCEDKTAVTSMPVMPGDAVLWVEPECLPDNTVADPASFEAPAPLARRIVRGEVVTLNTVLIMVETNCEGRPCICKTAASLVSHTEPGA